MRPRSLLLAAIAAMLGGATAGLPAVAGSETVPSIEAYEYGSGYSYHYWQPSTAMVAPGGVVKFGNPYATTSHGLKFTGGPATPSCSGVPTAEAGATSWHGECSFPAAGTYTFICTVHPTEMKGTITVTAGGTTTTTTSTTGGTTQTQSPGSTTGSTSTPGAGTPTPATPGSPFAGARPLSLYGSPSSSHARTVRGSLLVSTAGAGGRLEVDVLAARASLARARAAGHAGRAVLVGKLVRSAVPAGRVAFAVALNGRALKALRTHHRLAVVISVRLTMPASSGGVTKTLTGHLLLRR